jgi:hypothetical protein
MASGQALPVTSPYFKNAERKDDNDPWQEAYKTCLQYEAQARSHLNHLLCSRVLGYLIREAPYDKSRDNICQDINSCNGEYARLQALADLYIRSFVQVCRYQAPILLLVSSKMASPLVSETNTLILTRCAGGRPGLGANTTKCEQKASEFSTQSNIVLVLISIRPLNEITTNA